LSVIASAAKQSSILTSFPGLLRCARNDENPMETLHMVELSRLRIVP